MDKKIKFGKKAAEFQDKMEESLSELKKDAKVNMAKAKKDLLEAEKRVADYIKKNPAKAAAIAAGIGAAVGAVLTALIKKDKD